MSYILRNINRFHDYLMLQEQTLEQQLVQLEWGYEQQERNVQDME